METKELWIELKNNISDKNIIDADLQKEYLDTAKLIKDGDKEYTIIIKSQLGMTLLSQYKEDLTNEIKDILDNYVVLNFLTKEAYDKSKKTTNANKKNSYNENSLTFDNFIVGESNKQAFLAAKAVVANPGSSFNPLFIYGDSGLGKTHLLHSITNKILTDSKENKVLFMSSEDFTQRIVMALNKGDLKEIENLKYEINSYEVFILDDIQFLSKKEKTNEFFFNIINNFLDSGKQLIFSSDKTPELLNGFDKRMITRFNSGLSVSINTLDLLTAKLIIEFEIKKQGLKQKVKEEAIVFLAQNFGDDVRKIKGIVNRIVFFYSQDLENSTIDLSDVMDLFKDTPSINMGLVNVKKIKEVVGNRYGVTLKAIDGKARTNQIKDARHVSMYLTRSILNHTSIQIGNEFGGKDHSTVLSAINRIQKLIDKEKEFKKIIEELKNQITEKQ